jgi:pimeloyl-ACP methyl ester carboxylesterase
MTPFYRDEGPATAIHLTSPANPDSPASTTGAKAPSLPLVLIHGYAEDGTLWDRQTDYLKKGHRVIIPDLPGSGRSPLLPGETSIEELAESIKTVLDTAQIEQCILVGHSMGGYITLAFAEKYPSRVKAIGLFHSTAYPDSEEKIANRRKSIEFIRKNGSAPFIRQSTPNLFAGPSRQQHPELVSSLIERYAGFDPDSLVAYYEAMIKRPDRTEVLKKFTGPVLFIIGQQDNAIPLEQSLQQTHMPSISHIYILSQSGHLGMLEESDRSNRILDEFLNHISHHHSLLHI